MRTIGWLGFAAGAASAVARRPMLHVPAPALPSQLGPKLPESELLLIPKMVLGGGVLNVLSLNKTTNKL